MSKISARQKRKLFVEKRYRRSRVASYIAVFSLPLALLSLVPVHLDYLPLWTPFVIIAISALCGVYANYFNSTFLDS